MSVTPQAPDLVVLEPREVRLTPRSTTVVRRTLPHRDLRMIGAWCFVDHYGPDTTSDAPMRVAPHPHTGLQTVTWLVDGLVEHRDSLGTVQRIAPGELNVMTAGHGISHSEMSVDDESPQMHGVQLWVALPEGARETAPMFHHHADLPVVTMQDATLRVLAGSLHGATAPTTTFTPLVGAELVTQSSGTWDVDVDAAHEHGVLMVSGAASIEGTQVPRGSLLYLAPGRTRLTVTSDGPVRALLIGGEPFAEEIVMWWNFIGRTHDEVEAMRAQWEGADPRFGTVQGYPGDRIPAPPMPAVRLAPRGRARGVGPLIDVTNPFS